MSIIVRPAQTDSERTDVFRLKYRVYVEEMAVPLEGVDHAAKIVREPLDEWGVLLAAYDGHVLVGSSRINFGADGDLGPYADWLRMRRFAGYFPSRVSLRTRFFMAPEARAGGLVLPLMRAGYRMQLDRRVAFDFSECRRDDAQLWKRFGYRWLFPRFAYPGDETQGPHVPLVLAVQDYRRLSRRGSPYRKMIAPEQDDRGAVADLVRFCRLPQLATAS
jgi:N-acyl amino acid synthase FeeM